MSSATININKSSRISERFGRHGVYKASQMSQIVAVKIRESAALAYQRPEVHDDENSDDDELDKENKRKLGELMALNHDHVARFIGVSTVTLDSKTYRGCLVMEYGAGGSLHTALKNHALYQKRLAQSIIQQIASGLEYLHSKGKLHGNLKASNVIFKDENRTQVMISDFCLPKTYRDDSSIPTVFQRTHNVYTRGCDVFSLAAIARAIINNEMPMRLPTVEQLETEYDMVTLKEEHPERYKAIFNSLFRDEESAPSAAEFTAAFTPCLPICTF
ncbi:putative myosin light chain kinase-like [Tropilaelaps mercedesae]|uniref:Putative myosin light chain kinase-like n=1 Tax=Tropilaelaps mercedesae TaxID=418985 RepID=A0A1V9XAF5_9ACAR|nr:putative myosin light chain kinase-like [Tropilaelaps mercedesae]